MQVTNSNVNFKGISYFCPTDKVKDAIHNRMPKNLLEKYMERFEKSPVTVTFGLADTFGDRLDATVLFRKPSQSAQSEDVLFKYIEEKRRFNLLDLAPKRFFKEVQSFVDSFETKFGVNKI